MATIPLKPQLPIPEAFRSEYLEYYRMLPLEIVGDRLRVAVAGETNGDALADLRQSYGVELELITVEREALQDAIRQVYAASESVMELVRDLDGTVGPSDRRP